MKVRKTPILNKTQVEAALDAGYVFICENNTGWQPPEQLHEMMRCDELDTPANRGVHGYARPGVIQSLKLPITRIMLPDHADGFVAHRPDHPGVKHWQVSLHYTNRPNDPCIQWWVE